MNRIAITGIGAISPLGLNAAETWSSVQRGVSGLGPRTQPVLPGVWPGPVCEVKGFDPETVLTRKEAGRQDRYQHLALAAAQEAVAEAGLSITDENRHRIGVVISASSGGYQTFERELLNVREKGGRACSPFAITKIMPNGAAALVAMRFGACGPSCSIATACASSADALGHALLLLRAGMCDAVLAGGTEASLHTISLASFDRMGLLSKRSTDTPSPFCQQRDGLIIGEGAAVFVLETFDHARRRGANIHAELAGYGSTSDAYHITTPASEGAGAVRAIAVALNDAGVHPADIDYINAHGTGSRINDAVETKAIKTVFGAHARTTPISSTKSMTGHLMGAAGAMELAFCVMAIRDSVIPPTINFRERDIECDLDYVPNVARDVRVKAAISNSFGFGGHNSTLVVKSFRHRTVTRNGRMWADRYF
jgi:3-oxoacyl-[acyl-carrier-protein] synthase II